jgi:hypothetical protein
MPWRGSGNGRKRNEKGASGRGGSEQQLLGQTAVIFLGVGFEECER